jgi:hypothetical protein
MTNVQLNETVAAALHAQASALGLSVDDYLTKVLLATPSVRLTSPKSGIAARLTIEELDRLFDEESSGDPSPAVRLSSPKSGTFSRAEIYSDHA